MAYFRVNTDSLNDGCAELYRYSNICNQYANTLAGMNFSCLSDNVQSRVEKTIRILSDNLTQSGRHFYKESLGLGYVMNEYQKTEKCYK